MKKIFLVLLIMVIPSIFATTTVKSFVGKVKVKYDGDSAWSKIEVGQELPDNTLISTGFNSTIVLDLGNAILDVLPLTRMTLSEITETQDTIQTALFLQGGKIKADVGKIEGKVNDFKIKSPIATASVRGTAFEFTGNTLTVLRGEVSFAKTQRNNKPQPVANSGKKEDESSSEEKGSPEDSSGSEVAVRAGGQSQMSAPGAKPASPKAMAQEKRSVNASTKPAVIKDVVTTMEGGELVGQEVPIPSVVQATSSGLTKITITINPVE